ncbi:MAG: hypothetical protein ACPG4T_18115 [Nannocystaceae bacterium]
MSSSVGDIPDLLYRVGDALLTVDTEVRAHHPWPLFRGSCACSIEACGCVLHATV